ncbi:hypothetical protein H072_4937 [Dactylellina haptotyla CBS 200.50]|uniref:PLD phosphodiesterase domain-containing protein n=1 Tax=Dactylellina haptotyla (strain CBS 200.50) TaxID=1284197 RepID=S8ADZ9_DACHA|nr:hypothetical protein H072_4937 [Dactylellina haptotyla CBS 200.50]
MADDYDADLAEAIRRSLLDQPGSPSQANESTNTKPTPPTEATRVKKEVKKELKNKVKKEGREPPIIVLDDSSDDDQDDEEAVKQTIKKEEPQSRVKKEVKQEVSRDRVKEEVKQEESDKQEKPRPSGMLNLDRAHMEQERLARLKRKTPDDSHVPQAKHVKSIALPGNGIKKEAPRASSWLGSGSESGSGSRSGSNIGGRNPFMTIRDLQKRVSYYVPQQYLDGVVKRTFIQGAERTSDDITLEEILQKDTLQTAVLSAFTWDFMWILDKLKVGECDLVLVVSAKEDELVDHYRRNLCNIPRTRLCFPDMSGNINCMHSKLQLLFHLTYLRVVVPTANLTPYDWGEDISGGRSGGVMENSVFIIDFPELPKTSITGASNPSHTYFSRELLHFCKAKGLPADIIKKVDSIYDFTKSEPLAFIYSIGGSHHGEDALRNGVCGLANAVKNLGLKTTKPLEVDYVTSSIGNLNKEFLLRIYRALRGDEGKKSVQGIPKKYSKLQQTNPEDESTASETEEEDESDDKVWRDLRASTRIYFPSRRTVATSKGGLESGGTICFQRKWFTSSSFPSSLLHDCQSTRRGMLMHNKIIFVRFSRPKPKAVGWAYIGSANLSESAWGKLVWDRSQKVFKMSNRNWECGVILPVTLPSGQDHAQEATTEGKPIPDLGVFTNVIPVPMSMPAPLLSADNPPWYFGELRGNP